jgi:hypothetical protein
MPPGPEVGATVASGCEVARGRRLRGGTGRTCERALAFRFAGGMRGDAGTPAARAGLE